MYSIWRKFKTSQSRRKATRSQGLNRQRLFNIEPLQTRDLLTVTFTPLPQTWVSEGPAPILDGQTAGLTSPANPVTGAVKAIAVTPNNPDIIFVATVNGGIWKTTNGTSGTPTWTPETDSANSLSMSSISFDLSDGTY